MKVLLDTDVILDLILDRQPFSQDASDLWDANLAGLYEGYVAAITLLNVFYIARKIKGTAIARQAVQEILAAFKVCNIDHSVLSGGLISAIIDYEDAVQEASAKSSGLDRIITRNLKDYTSATFPVLSPTDFLNQLPFKPSNP